MKHLLPLILGLNLSCGMQSNRDQTLLASSQCPTIPQDATCTTLDQLNLRSDPVIADNILGVANPGVTFQYARETRSDGNRCWIKLGIPSKGFGWGAAEFLSCKQENTTTTNPGAGPSHILYPGDPGCGGKGCETPGMSDPDIQIPARNGQPWGDTYQLGGDQQKNLAGYSSGRIALLRRLALRNNGEWAILLDPSWEDNARDFLSNGSPVTGDSIVKKWLINQPQRRFLIVYSTQSSGWSRYVDLKNDAQVGSRVKVCAVNFSHLDIPRRIGPQVILSPESYNSGNCR